MIIMFNEKVVLVTGGTRGIGYTTVEEFLKEGARVILFGSREESVTKAINSLKEVVLNFMTDKEKCMI